MTIKKKEKPRMSKSEAGRLGALALKADPAKKAAATKKAAETRKAKNPNAFKEMGSLEKTKNGSS